VFGSFFSEVGEVQKLFLLCDAYFNKFNPKVNPRPDVAMYASPLREDENYRSTAPMPAPM
jgi:hypothetical protein